MSSNIESYRQDLQKLIESGDALHMAIQYEHYPEAFAEKLEDKLDDYVK